MSGFSHEPDSEPSPETELAEELARLSVVERSPGTSILARLTVEQRRSSASHFPSLEIINSRSLPTATVYQHPRIDGSEAVRILHRYIGELYPVDDRGRQVDIRYYVVWLTPEQREGEGRTILTGLHFGLGDRAYRGILSANGDIFRTLSFRRVPDLNRGREVFLREFARHGVARELGDRFFIWQ